MRKLSILFVSPEAYPLMKTGGLGDVAGSLPQALHNMGHDVRLVMPAYADTLKAVSDIKPIAAFSQSGRQVCLLECMLPGTQVRTWLVDCPKFFMRPGNPYLNPDGLPWEDNAQRFSFFCRVAANIALDQVGLDWVPDIVHCNDWQTGLVPALLDSKKTRPATVFTIHNLAYQGLFPYETFKKLKLSKRFWAYDALEFHGKFSFIKGGLVYADQITTVSRTYAQEIQTPEFGYDLDGLLCHRSHVLSGILNGIDDREWNPASDQFLVRNYTVHSLDRKLQNKLALQEECGLPTDPDVMLLGSVGRLVEQKGIDMIIDALPDIMKLPVQAVFLGTGQLEYEQALQDLAQQYPNQLYINVGYNEQFAHRIEAGADVFLMPSRFEPCGLNQMYSLRYGTVPMVRKVGGLADTVVDASPDAINSNEANGIIINESLGGNLDDAVQRVLALYHDKPVWRQLQQTGMQKDFSWHKSASQYLEVYLRALRQAA